MSQDATLRPIVHLLRSQSFLMLCYFETDEVTVRSRAPAALLNNACVFATAHTTAGLTARLQ